MDEKSPSKTARLPFWKPTAGVTGAVLVFHDVTQRRRAQEELRESEQRYRNLFESMDEGFAICEMIYDQEA